MPAFSRQSLRRLDTCHTDLIVLALEVVKHFDCTVVWGHRGEEEQNEFFNSGTSRCKYPNSKHNRVPSLAVDLVPYLDGGIVWEESQCYYFAGMVMGIYHKLRSAGIVDNKIRTGADWDMDLNVNDQDFIDICHFEIVLPNEG